MRGEELIGDFETAFFQGKVRDKQIVDVIWKNGQQETHYKDTVSCCCVQSYLLFSSICYQTLDLICILLFQSSLNLSE